MKNFQSSDLIEKLEFYYSHGKNVLLSGHKGVGKTAIISIVLNKLAKKWLYFSGSTLDPFIDFIGIPKEKVNDEGVTTLEFIRPSYMNEEVEAIFIDEYNRSAKKIRNAIMELIQFKSLNGQKFPNLKVVWAGVNPYNPEDEDEIYDVEPIDPAQKDRFQIQIDIPYAMDVKYFTEKFNVKWSKGAAEWWSGLPERIRIKVSPRRVDYALEVYQLGGDIADVLPIESNPSKLLASLKSGGIEKILVDIFMKKDFNKALKFISSENNYQSCSHLMVQNLDWANFFFPLLDEERQISLFFSNKPFQSLILNNPTNYKPLLEMIEKNSLFDTDLRGKVSKVLRKMNGVDVNNFQDASENLKKELVLGENHLKDFFKKEYDAQFI